MSEHDKIAYGSYIAVIILTVLGYFVARRNRDKLRQYLQVSVLFFWAVEAVTNYLNFHLPETSIYDPKVGYVTLLSLIGIGGTSLTMLLCGTRAFARGSYTAYTILLAFAHIIVGMLIFGIGFYVE